MNDKNHPKGWFLSLFISILIRYSFTAVFNVDRAAGNETVFGEEILHCDVVFVRVGADVFAVGFAEIQRGFANAANFSVTCHAVHDVIRFIVGPCAVFNNGVRWVIAFDKRENAVYYAVFRADVQVSVFNVGAHGFARRISPAPLCGVAMLAHILACAFVNSEYFR